MNPWPLTFILIASSAIAAPPDQENESPPDPKTVKIERGDLSVTFRENSPDRHWLSGIASLYNVKDASGYMAFDQDDPRGGVGINFEHIISDHADEHNAFSPRMGLFPITALGDGRSVILTRKAEEDPWKVSSTLKYTVTEPHYIDIDFRCTPHDKSRFDQRGYALFFFCNYMNDVIDPALHFRGVESATGEEKWIAVDASDDSHPDWNTGGTWRNVAAPAIEYDATHNFKLNSWSYEWPRYTKPFYYGLMDKGMVYIVMFDRAHTPIDEIRLSLFKFKLKKVPRPAWDFEYVVHQVVEGREYGYKARVVFKKYISPEDCLNEYERWAKSLAR